MAIRRQVHAGHPHSLGVPLLGSIKVDTQTCGIKWKPPFDRRDIRGNRLSDAVVRLVVRFGDNQVSAGGGDGRPVPGRRPCGIYVPGRPSGRHLVRRRHVRGPDDAQLRRQSDRAQGGARHTDRVRRTARPPEAVRGVTVLAAGGVHFTDDELNRVYTPVGLDLGGDTPFHVAQSIVVEVTAVHHDRSPNHLTERAGLIHARSPVGAGSGPDSPGSDVHGLC